MDLKIDDGGGFRLNYANIANAEWLLPTIRLLALDMQKNPYVTVGDWFRGLSKSSLEEIQELAEVCYEDEENSDAIEQLMLLSMMLALAEGTGDLNDMESNHRQLGMLMSLITIVSLERKGFVRVFYDNLTLGSDMGDRFIV